MNICMTLQKISVPVLKFSWVSFSWFYHWLSFLWDTSRNLLDKRNGRVLKIAPVLTVIVLLLQLEINQLFVQSKK